VTSLLQDVPPPEYRGGSIVNLMASILRAFGGDAQPYPALQALPPEEINGYRHVVLLVIDALGYQQLLRIAPEGALAAHCRSAMDSVFPPTTASAITTYLTGTAPQQHGLTGWHMFLSELGAVLAVLPGTPRFGGVGLAQAGVDTAALHAHQPLSARMNARCVTVSPRRIARSDFNLAHLGSAELRAYATLDQLVDYSLAAVTGVRERSFVYAYWADLDHIGHEHGIGSTEAAKELARLDAAFERLAQGLRARDSLLLVTADHGMIDTRVEDGIDLSEHPQLAELLRLPLCGERRAAYCYLRPGTEQAFRDYVSSELSECLEAVPSSRLIEGGYLGLGAAHPRLGERMGDYTLLGRGGHYIRDRLFGEKPHLHVGMHGGLSSPELQVPLIVAPH
jgi:hypothetical protein